MRARLQAWIEAAGDQFWLRPALVVIFCMLAAQAAVWVETAQPSASGTWGYGGGAEGARALLGAVASSSIGVAGTTFSITIAALSLAAGQMGPRLLRTFVRDSRNQVALGIFLGTFAYSLLVLRTIRTQQEGTFVPHAAVTGAIALAVVCIGTLVWFVHHVATSINVEHVVDSVHRDLVSAIETGTLDKPGPARVALDPGTAVASSGSNYLQAVDLDGLADWAAEAGTVVLLKVRPGEYVPLGLPIAEVTPAREDAGDVLDGVLTFGRQQASLQDLEYTVRQLNEIAVRALSPGINDPFTACSVLERFGDALCRISTRHLPTGVVERNGSVVVQHQVTDYDGLCDGMFHTIRQNGAGSAFVLLRLLEVLTKVATVERATDRLAELRRHAALVVDTGRRQIEEDDASKALTLRWQRFEAAYRDGPAPFGFVTSATQARDARTDAMA